MCTNQYSSLLIGTFSRPSTAGYESDNIDEFDESEDRLENNVDENGNYRNENAPKGSLAQNKTRSKTQGSDPRKPARNESAVSKGSNAVTTRAHNSTLTSKVFAMEENLKRLQSIVGSLISQIDGNSNMLDSMDLSTLLGQLQENTDQNIAPNTLEYTSNDRIQPRGRNTSMRLGNEQDDGSNVEHGCTKENMCEVSGKSSRRRAVSQPLPTSAKQKPVPSRSKTASTLLGNKQLARQGSVLEKLKRRRFVPTIDEEASQAEHGMKGVNVE